VYSGGENEVDCIALICKHTRSNPSEVHPLLHFPQISNKNKEKSQGKKMI